MKKRRCRLLPAVLFAVLLVSPVHAEETERWVEYGNGKLENNFPAGDLADTVNKMQPGDTATFTIHLKNADEVATDWYMRNDVTKNMEKDSQATGGAYSYTLTYQAGNDVQILYDSDRINGTDASEVAAQADGEERGLSEAVSSLKDYFYLDSLAPGETAQVVLTIGLDGETQGNVYQDRDARLLMNFAVEEGTRQQDTPQATEPDQPRTETIYRQVIRTISAVQTGDANNLLFWSVILGLSAAGMAGLLIYERISRRKGGANHE